MKNQFDQMASTYDEDFTRSEIGKRQRQRVWNYLESHIFTKEKKLNILELNCGTGEDALHFTVLGHTVTATDSSPKMLEIARHKAHSQKKITFQQISLETLAETGIETKYDLIFSNFGGINCISPEVVNQLAIKLSDSLTPDGRMVWILMPRFCIWESLYFLAKAAPANAFRRLSKESVLFKTNQSEQSIWYYSPDQIRSKFRDKLTVKNTLPIGFFLPPSYLEPRFSTRIRLLDWLFKLEKGIPSWFSGWSDHFLIDLQKR